MTRAHICLLPNINKYACAYVCMYVCMCVCLSLINKYAAIKFFIKS